MLVLGMLLGDDGARSGCYLGGTNPITQTNGRSPALTRDFYVMGVLPCNTTVLLW